MFNFLLFWAADASMFVTGVVTLTSMYASLYSHKLDYSIDLLNLI